MRHLLDTLPAEQLMIIVDQLSPMDALSLLSSSRSLQRALKGSVHFIYDQFDPIYSKIDKELKTHIK